MDMDIVGEVEVDRALKRYTKQANVSTGT